MFVKFKFELCYLGHIFQKCPKFAPPLCMHLLKLQKVVINYEIITDVTVTFH